MKAFNVIVKADEFKTNIWSVEDKLKWLDELEHTVYTDMVLTHENPNNIEYSKVTEDTEFIAPDRFSDMYIFWLLSKIDLHNGDMTRYANNSTLYNQAYTELQNWWNRTYMPLQNNSFKG